jgi:hydrogenase nickel incorporation protein HypA/HybF
MHEFSLACNILEIVEENVNKHKASRVTELTLDIGSLAGVELQALQTAIEIIQAKTILGGARINYNIISAVGVCPHCNLNFEPADSFSPCPQCNNFGIQIVSGKELIVKSIIVE